MAFKRHSELENKHATLSASKYHWLRYTDERLFEYVDNLTAAMRGTKLHEFAKDAIKLKIKQRETNETVNLYINDCIGFRMEPEVTLVYHPVLAFGTADAISWRDRVLRIWDLKTGTSKASPDQLLVYAAFFCLEYGVKPYEVEEYDLRIYQNDDIAYYEVTPEEVAQTMSRIVDLCALLLKRMAEEV